MLLHETWKMSTGVLKTEEHRLNGGGGALDLHIE
jgi:hypothetical protein